MPTLATLSLAWTCGFAPPAVGSEGAAPGEVDPPVQRPRPRAAQPDAGAAPDDSGAQQERRDRDQAAAAPDSNEPTHETNGLGAPTSEPGSTSSTTTAGSTDEPAGTDPVEYRREVPQRVEQPWGNTSATEGPYFIAEPLSEIPEPVPTPRVPRLSVRGGAFCFVEDSTCRASLLAYADVSVGSRIVSGTDAESVPYTQIRAGGGFVVRPLFMSRGAWHPWGIGLHANWSLGSGPVVYVDEASETADRRATTPIRIAMMNQIWLSQRRFAPHVDLSIGAVNSEIFQVVGRRLWGTHVEAGLGFGGWAGFVLGADFLSRDTRVSLGFRTHAIAAAPVTALVLIGLVAGGVSLGVGGSAP